MNAEIPQKPERMRVKAGLLVLAYFVFSFAMVFVFTNSNSLVNILKGHPEKTYSVNELSFTRWIATEPENTFCSELDPIIHFPVFDGYIHSIELDMVVLEDTPECTPKLFWTDAEHPVFTEECSQELYPMKTDRGYLLEVGRNVSAFRLDLYDHAGAKIQLRDVWINPRPLTFPITFIFPICIIGFLLIYILQNSNKKNVMPKGSSKREKIEELDFIRAICAIGIILFHVSCYVPPSSPKLMYTYANGGYGTLLVGVFFLISGGVLYYNYREIRDLLTFYYKRWKSVFPMFYITFLFFFVRNAITANTVFYNGEPWKLLLSVFGLDGYFNYKYPGYYIVGEWFLGAIVLLYVLYPIFVKLVNTAEWKVLFFIIPLTLWQLKTDWFEISATTNLIYCSTLFIIGMLIFKYTLYRNKWLKMASCLISLLVIFVSIPNFTIFKSMISYVFIFFALFTVAEFVIKVQPLKNLFACIGGLSFPMFLVQNRVIGFLTKHITVDTYSDLVKVMLLAVCLSMICAWGIHTISQGVMRTKWFTFIDKAILSLKYKGE